MQAQRTTAPSAVTAEFLDMLACAADAPQALALIDACRDRIAGGGIFSIQQNVTCADDAPGQVLLRRFYSSASGTFPVNGTKRKTLTRWTQRLFVEGRPFIGEGEAELAEHFDDFEQMQDSACAAWSTCLSCKGRSATRRSTSSAPLRGGDRNRCWHCVCWRWRPRGGCPSHPP
ncbi:MAG: hypothetical protein J7603_18725 [Pseudacidovorax sp.]|nr:hypothetical protein [Pseudacidovorax sp.]